MSVSFHADLLVAAHTAVLGEIDGAGATAYVEIRDVSDVLLSTLPLDFPAGTVDAGTGQLTCVFGLPDLEAAATGTADHADICDAAAKILITLSCEAGVTPVADACVLTTLSIVQGAPVEGVSLTIG